MQVTGCQATRTTRSRGYGNAQPPDSQLVARRVREATSGAERPRRWHGAI